VPLTINSGIFPPGSPGTPTLTAVLTSSETGPFSAVPASNGTGGLLAAVTNNEAVYEITSILPASLTTVESLSIPVSLNYSGSQGTFPSAGNATVAIDFAATSLINTATSGPVPRFYLFSPNLNSYSVLPALSQASAPTPHPRALSSIRLSLIPCRYWLMMPVATL
jgi:hypothetical protein